jgi:hypothetical protein
VGFGPGYAGHSASQYALLALSVLVRMATYWGLGLYPGAGGLTGGRWSVTPTAAWVRLLAAWALSSLALAALMLALLAGGILPSFPRLVLVYEAGFALAGLALTRALGGYFARGASWRAAVGLNLPLLADFVRRAGVVFAPTAASLVAYMAFYQLYFGTPSPVSGQIKRWWGTLPHTIYGHTAANLAELLGFSHDGPWKLAVDLLAGPFNAQIAAAQPSFGPWKLATVLLQEPAGSDGGAGQWLPALLGIASPLWSATLLWSVALLAALLYLVYAQRNAVRGAITRLNLVPLAAGALLHLLSYTGTGYLHMRSWYWTAQMLLITLLLAVICAALLTVLPARLARPLQIAASLALIAALGASLVQNFPYTGGSMQTVERIYGITELAQRTPPGARIGSTGGGVIAYLLPDRTIVNLDGLMNTNAYYHALREGHAAAYLDEIGLQFVFSGEYALTSSDPYFQFAHRLVKIADFGGATLFDWMKE